MITPAICFGEILWDVLPDGPMPGGAPLNVAYHLNKLGLSTSIISKIGNDEKGLSVSLDYSLPELELEAERFAQRINVPRPSWNRMLSEEERKNRPTGTKVDVWETLEQLVK